MALDTTAATLSFGLGSQSCATARRRQTKVNKTIAIRAIIFFLFM
jgi:preprotein translocase subunit SecG